MAIPLLASCCRTDQFCQRDWDILPIYVSAQDYSEYEDTQRFDENNVVCFGDREQVLKCQIRELTQQAKKLQKSIDRRRANPLVHADGSDPSAITDHYQEVLNGLNRDIAGLLEELEALPKDTPANESISEKPKVSLSHSREGSNASTTASSSVSDSTDESVCARTPSDQSDDLATLRSRCRSKTIDLLEVEDQPIPQERNFLERPAVKVYRL
jgi:hypothetical protein